MYCTYKCIYCSENNFTKDSAQKQNFVRFHHFKIYQLYVVCLIEA